MKELFMNKIGSNEGGPTKPPFPQYDFRCR